jgi:DNA helicase-2/ATP-dependent DNA helicase PcrA
MNTSGFSKPRSAYRRTAAREEKKYFTDTMPDYENESQVATTQHKVGARVEHENFGKGRIVAINGNGADARAVVDFESVGRKHLMLKFANLKTA